MYIHIRYFEYFFARLQSTITNEHIHIYLYTHQLHWLISFTLAPYVLNIYYDIELILCLRVWQSFDVKQYLNLKLRSKGIQNIIFMKNNNIRHDVELETLHFVKLDIHRCSVFYHFPQNANEILFISSIFRLILNFASFVNGK